MINRNELKQKVPHGYANKIAKRAGVSNPTVSKWFKYELDSDKVEMAVLETLAELSQEKKAAEGRKEQLLAQIL